jgi:hypothetical protein
MRGDDTTAGRVRLRAFEKVALADMPPLPEGATAPYDMGWLNLMQIPQSWSEAVVALRRGQVSDVLRGDGARFWIIKLMDRRDNPGVTFEASRAALGQRLAVGSRERQRDALVQALRRAARIEYRPYGTRGGGRE